MNFPHPFRAHRERLAQREENRQAYLSVLRSYTIAVEALTQELRALGAQLSSDSNIVVSHLKTLTGYAERHEAKAHGRAPRA